MTCSSVKTVVWALSWRAVYRLISCRHILLFVVLAIETYLAMHQTRNLSARIGSGRQLVKSGAIDILKTN